MPYDTLFRHSQDAKMFSRLANTLKNNWRKTMTQSEFIKMLRENYNKMLLTKKETAKEVGVSEATIDRLRKDGLITSKKVMGQIFFDIGEIARFLSDS